MSAELNSPELVCTDLDPMLLDIVTDLEPEAATNGVANGADDMTVVIDKPVDKPKTPEVIDTAWHLDGRDPLPAQRPSAGRKPGGGRNPRAAKDKASVRIGALEKASHNKKIKLEDASDSDSSEAEAEARKVRIKKEEQAGPVGKYDGFFDPNMTGAWLESLPSTYWQQNKVPTLAPTVTYVKKSKKSTAARRKALAKSRKGNLTKKEVELVTDTPREVSDKILKELHSEELQDSEPCFESPLEIWEEYDAWRNKRLDICRRAVEADPTSPLARDEFANVLVAAGKYPVVIKFFRGWWNSLKRGWEDLDFLRDWAFIQNW